MSDTESRIHSLVKTFAADLARLLRQEALATVKANLERETSVPAARRGRTARVQPARPRVTPPAAHARAGKAAAKPGAGPVRAPGQKRDPRELAQLVERLAEYIKSNPGQRVEQINKALGVPTKDLTLPIKKLLHAKRITTKGEKRATTYSPK